MIIIGGASGIGGMASNKIYSFSRSTQSDFVYLGKTTQSRFSQVSILVPQNFIHCEDDVEITTESEIEDPNNDESIDFMGKIWHF